MASLDGRAVAFPKSALIGNDGASFHLISHDGGSPISHDGGSLQASSNWSSLIHTAISGVIAAGGANEGAFRRGAPIPGTRNGAREEIPVHFRLIAVGKIREPYLVAAADDFTRRLAPYHRLTTIEVRADGSGNAARAAAAESAAVLNQLAPGDVVWLLERTGGEMSSEELAQRLEALALAGTSRITFVVAGTFGAAPELVARADVLWSLSRLTFLHEWARAIVLEQLYRASKIARGERYHH